MGGFRKCGYTVRLLQGPCFEFVSTEFPAATHVFATPYFLQLTTFLNAAPKDRVGKLTSTRNDFLNVANQAATLVKLTCDSDVLDPKRGGWRVKVQAKLVPGDIRRTYGAKAIKSLVTLWLYDIANVILLKHRYDTAAFRSQFEKA